MDRPNASAMDRLDRSGARGCDERRALGRLGERLAVEHLRRLGFAIVARNVRTRHGEIDLIASRKGVLAFVEVKTRRAKGRGQVLAAEDQPLARLRFAQRRRLARLARAWLHESAGARPRSHTIRFDAIGVIVDRTGNLLALEHVEGAW
jgi:putative endonuclease